jgi:hypothetical protein
MRDALINAADLTESFKSWMVEHTPETIMGAISAIVTLVLVLLAHKITKRLILEAMKRQNRSDFQIKQFATMWKYMFMLVGIVFVVVSMSASLAAMGHFEHFVDALAQIFVVSFSGL